MTLYTMVVSGKQGGSRFYLYKIGGGSTSHDSRLGYSMK